MPKRTRSQRIAEKSRRALEARLDERFLFRPEFEDYGIDGSIEEFDTNDRTTGLRFLVQLKMVRYLAPADELYVRWWHDPLPGKRPPRADAASRTFHWSEEDIFETAGSDRLAEEARGYYELRSASPPLPFFFEMAVEEAPFRLGSTEIELSVEAAANRRPDVVEVRAAADRLTAGKAIPTVNKIASEASRPRSANA